MIVTSCGSKKNFIFKNIFKDSFCLFGCMSIMYSYTEMCQIGQMIDIKEKTEKP